MKTLLHHALAEQAQHRPDAVAVVSGQDSITWGELEKRSNQLARALQLAGCVRGDRVALLLPKSINALMGIFAALKAGCIYVPLDTASPPARLARVLDDCDNPCVVAITSEAPKLEESLRASFPRNLARVVWMDAGVELSVPNALRLNRWDITSLPGGPLETVGSETDPAYILFTSGSTGTPKGVVITHSNVRSFTEWAVGYFCIDASDRLSAHAPLYFDLSTLDIHGAVAAGAQLHLVPPDLGLFPGRLATFIRESQLTQWFSVPSILTHMAKSDVVKPNDFPSLRRLLWCGEKFPISALIHWMRRLPDVTFVNLYGPTETTVASSYYRVPRCPDDERAEIPIGAPCAGEQLFVLDEQLRPVPGGAAGELYIAGSGLSPGYWGDPCKTAEAFLNPRPDSELPERIYRTGDLARIGAGGEIYLIGRMDSQIKSRGYRIELGEIETAVQAVEGVAHCAVVAIETSGFEGAEICCACVPSPHAVLTPAAMNRRLAEVLPRYMLPSRWMLLERMPLNSSGKTDRPWLKQQFGQQTAPRNPGQAERSESVSWARVS